VTSDITVTVIYETAQHNSHERYVEMFIIQLNLMIIFATSFLPSGFSYLRDQLDVVVILTFESIENKLSREATRYGGVITVD